MKNYYLLLLTAFLGTQLNAQMGQIQNGSFENWTSNTLYESPTPWFTANDENWQGISTVSKSTDASHAMYSIEISAKEVGPNPDTTFGYFLHGSIGQSGPDGGIPYTDVFNEVTFDYKSDLPVGDTIYLVMFRFDGTGTPIEQILLPAFYGTNGTWTAGSIPITSTPQSELFIGFVIGDPFTSSNMPTPDAWGRIDNVVLKNNSVATTSLPNFSFENWTSVSTEDPDNWSTLNSQLAPLGLENTIKTTDANSGTYAAQLTTVYNPQWNDTIGGMVLLGTFDFNGPNPFIPAPYNGTPSSFSYAYKYAPTNGDPSGGIMVQFFSGGSIIGFDVVNATPQATYTTGTIPLNYVGTPDSVMVAAFSGDSIGSVMHVDDFSFSGGNVGLEEFATMEVEIYPNPASDFVMIKSKGQFNFKIIDVTGKVIHEEKQSIGIQTINTSNYLKGIYFVQIDNYEEQESYKLIIR